MKNIISFCSASTRKKLIIIRVTLILIKVKAIVNFFPLKSYFIKYFETDSTTRIDLQPFQYEMGYIRKILNLLPINTTCLIECMVMQNYFRKFGVYIPINIGVSKESFLKAHAWIESKDSPGYEKLI